MRPTTHLARLSLAMTLGFRAVAASSPGNDDDDDDTPLPLVIWHGLGDAFNGEGLQQVGALAEAVNPGTFVYVISLGGADANADRSATFLGNVTEQVETVCSLLGSHPILSTAPAIDALGFSQGGQFLRGYVERCNDPPVRSLVTYGSQHNGITEFRSCGATDWLCRGAMALLRYNTFGSFVQGRLVPAQYYRDPTSQAAYDDYLAGSHFLADINNEGLRGADHRRNATYAANMARLENFVMYKFDDDSMVVPPLSSWFAEVNGTDVTPLRERALYKEDWLGLAAIDAKGGLRFRSVPGEHMRIDDKSLNETFSSFFGPFGRSFEPEKPVAFQDEL
ncbi:palmitoyl-protein thioesterase [Geosmithia morbida]|uniref:Palmitoyl-protein thioesterase 1 n=1 Tax=Geosmithia morbida TaxID=1094350 RepID=A0A9P4YWP4_9HYPO|nr:palmitoyl-protein thioesterase [Geosmithia morbida]KAF4123086.1 palmitoyl-protein thioesterase [Geosmithia morbida]